MYKLTAAQSQQINTANYTHNYEAEALAKWDAGDNNVAEKYTRLFEKQAKVTKGKNIGGLIVYIKDAKLIAFYDYERFVGTVF